MTNSPERSAVYKRCRHVQQWPDENRCETCGTTENLVKHHEDYSKPLEITWLCRKDHIQRHRELGQTWGRPKGSKNKLKKVKDFS